MALNEIYLEIFGFHGSPSKRFLTPALDYSCRAPPPPHTFFSVNIIKDYKKLNR